MSDTALMLEKANEIMRKSKKGYTFSELWALLEESDGGLRKVMYNEENKPRVGLLQGLINRIKVHKLPNLYYNGSDKRIYYSTSDLALVKKLTKQYNTEMNRLLKPILRLKLNEDDYNNLTEIKQIVNQLNARIYELPIFAETQTSIQVNDEAEPKEDKS